MGRRWAGACFVVLASVGCGDGGKQQVRAVQDAIAVDPPAYDFGDVGGGEEDERDLRAHELVDRHTRRQEERQHHRCHEEQRDERHAADELDVADAEGADRRQPGAPAQGQQDRQRKRGGITPTIR